MDLDTRIFEALDGATMDKPRDLVGILYYVDSREKLVLSHEELAGGLKRLIERGQIAESTRHKFYQVSDGSSSRAFSGLTLDEHRRACDAYRKWFWKKYRELDKK